MGPLTSWESLRDGGIRTPGGGGGGGAGDPGGGRAASQSSAMPLGRSLGRGKGGTLEPDMKLSETRENGPATEGDREGVYGKKRVRKGLTTSSPLPEVREIEKKACP